MCASLYKFQVSKIEMHETLEVKKKEEFERAEPCPHIFPVFTAAALARQRKEDTSVQL